MPSLHLHDVSYAYSSATPVLSRVSLHLAATANPWIGVVGANGAGKTTLLRILAGQLRPQDGQVTFHADLAPVLVPQAVDDLTQDIRSFAWNWQGPAPRLRSRLGLDPDDLDARWLTLSPGQRKRWQLAATLAEEPDVLLLDEPTNHLDVDARDLLIATLEGFRGLGIIVSHDRAVLDRLTRRTVRIVDGDVQLHTGSYSEASVRWQEAEAAERAAHDRARKVEKAVRRQLADARRDRQATERGAAAERRQASHRTHDQRSTAQTERARRAESAHASRVTSTRSKLQRAEAEVAGFALRREHTGEVGFDHIASGRRILTAVTGNVAHGGGEVLLHDVEVVLRRGDRIHLAGSNGAGKTTLLGTLLRNLAETGEEVAYLAQELQAPDAELERVRHLAPALRGRVLGTVALLGVDPDRLLVTGDPSPGEARKLALARSLVEPASVLVLDEPTNHLDLPSIERLQQALSAWPGALVMVTHDHGLATAATTTTWRVVEGRVEVSDRA